MFTGGFVDGPYIEYRRDSRLASSGSPTGARPAKQELHYFEWEGAGFRKVLQLTKKKPGFLKRAKEESGNSIADECPNAIEPLRFYVNLR
jgi:hypothetical protein